MWCFQILAVWMIYGRPLRLPSRINKWASQEDFSEQVAFRAVQAPNEVPPKAFSCLTLRASKLRLQGDSQGCVREGNVASLGLKRGVTSGVGCGSEGQEEQECGCSIRAPPFLMVPLQILRGLWLYPLSALSLMIEPIYARDLQWNLKLWEHAIPRSQGSLSSSTAQGIVSISETGLPFTWLMSIATLLFTNMKAKACFFIGV